MSREVVGLKEVTKEEISKAKEQIFKSIQDRSNPKVKEVKVALIETYSDVTVGDSMPKDLVVALLENNKEKVEEELEALKRKLATKVLRALQTGKFAVTAKGKIFIGGFDVPPKVVNLIGLERMNLEDLEVRDSEITRVREALKKILEH